MSALFIANFVLNQLTFSHFIMKRIEVQFSLDTLQLLSLLFLLLIKVMFAHSYSENSHERASENNMLLMYSSVFSWRQNDMAESCVQASDNSASKNVVANDGQESDEDPQSFSETF